VRRKKNLLLVWIGTAKTLHVLKFNFDSMYFNELEIKDTTEYSTSPSYFDILLNYDANGKITIQLYNKHDDFSSSIVNFPYLRIIPSIWSSIYLLTALICKDLFCISQKSKYQS
jgi:hypothetical protein